MPLSMNFSLWESNAFFSKLDLIIVGSGIVGLSTAIEFKKRRPNARILVLERGFLPSGASTKNAGFACFGSTSELLDDLSKSEESIVYETVKMRYEGLSKLRKLIGDDSMDFELKGGFEVFDSKEKFQRCADQISYLNSMMSTITKHPCTYKINSEVIENSGMKGFDYAIENSFEGQIDTGKMMKSLLQICHNEQIMILNGISVKSLISKIEKVELVVSDDFSLNAKKVVIATNGFAKQFFPNEDIEPARAQVLVTSEIQNLKLRGCFHYEEGYYYFRNVGKRVLFGGGRNLDFKTENTKEFGLTETVQRKLEEILFQKILPNQNFEIAQRWSGIMGVGDVKKPIIKMVQPNVVSAIRMGGMGVAIGCLVGERAAKLAHES